MKPGKPENMAPNRSNSVPVGNPDTTKVQSPAGAAEADAAAPEDADADVAASVGSADASAAAAAVAVGPASSWPATAGRSAAGSA
jgi:hypothetical protein